MKTKLLTLTLAMLMMISLLGGCANQSPKTSTPDSPSQGESKELTKVVVTEFRGLSWAPMYVAYQLGYYKDEGLDLELLKIDDGPNCFRAMLAGESDFCILSQEVSLKAQEQGMRSTSVATVLDTRYYSFVAKSGITSVADLKGKTVNASTPGSAPYTFCVSIMEEAGLVIGKDVTLVTIVKGAIISALDKGEIQASFINADNYQEADNIADLHYLVDTRKAEDAKKYLKSDTFPAEVILSTEKFKNENPETVQAFVNATCKGLNWLQENSSQEAAETIAELFPGMDKESIALKIEIMRGAYSKNGYISTDGQKAVIDFCKRAGIITSDIPFEDVVDMSFVNKAIEAGIAQPSKK